MTKKKVAEAPVEEAPSDGQVYIQVTHKAHPTEGDTITATLPGASITITWTDPDHANVLMSQWDQIIDHLLSQAHIEDEAAELDSESAV